jgi:hypothetical protein
MARRRRNPPRLRDGDQRNDDMNQTKCWIATEGWMWMRSYFDRLPLPVRRRLQSSPFNLCPACLVTKFMPKVHARHPGYSKTRALLAAIEVMETQLQKR